MIFLFFLVFSVTALINADQFKIFAQDKASFSVSPPSFEINATTDSTINNSIKVDNLSSFPLKIKATAQNFVAYGEGGQVNITEEESTYAISRWINIEKSEQIVGPNNSAIYNFTIKIPKNAEAGSHYGAIVFATIPDKNIEGAGAAVSQEIGSLILIKLPGNVFEDARLLKFSSNKKVYQDPKITFNALLENRGNVHIKPYGFINITNIFGQKVKNFEVKGRNILPGSQRLFDEEIKFNPIGFFNAEITLLYSGGGKLIHGKTSFIAMNLPVLKKYLIFAAILFVIYLLFYKRVNRAVKVFFRG